ncbi:MAG: hypothetical protein ACQEQ8_09240 [Pseudomonadota bacterium]
MPSAFQTNNNFHALFAKASKQLQQHNYRGALNNLNQAQTSALSLSNDPIFDDNAKQNYVTVTLIIMGVLFRQKRHTDTLTIYHRLFHQLDQWLADAPDHPAKRRLRQYQALAEKACRALHLERVTRQSLK